MDRQVARQQLRRAPRRHWLRVALAVALLLAGAGFGLYRLNRDRILTALAIYLPPLLPEVVHQRIGFCTARDGVRIAYGTVGQGPPVVQALGWFSHLERGYGSAAYYGPFLKRMAARHLFVSYDGRGAGLSDRNIRDYSLDARVGDLEAVVDALQLDRFALYGISAGGPTVVAYTARHPERVSRLAFYGSFLKVYDTSLGTGAQAREALITLTRTSWGSENPGFRHMFTTLFIPDGTEVDMRVFTEMQRIAATPEDAADFLAATFRIDVTVLASQIRVPTLVIHRRGDAIVPFEAGRELASLIPGARLLPLEGRNHAFLRGEPEVEQLTQALEQFFAGN